MTAAVLVMAKAPRLGLAKTRLQPALGVNACAALQAELIRHTVATAAAAGPTYVSVAPADALPEVALLVPPQVTLFPQCDGNLGERLASAVAAVFDTCGGPVVVVGTDAPTLRTVDLGQALEAVGPGRIVLGPAEDGGYYLIAAPEPVSAVFAIPPGLWSGPYVLRATQQAATDAGYTTHRLHPLRDLDTPEDLGVLRADPALPSPIAALLDDRRAACASV